jgi:hypothetical protein
MFRTAHLATLSALFIAACASAPVPLAIPPASPAYPASGHDPTPFSTAVVLEVLPPGWRHVRLSRLKKPTEYRLTPLEGGSVAMMADADSSASVLQFETVVDLNEFPFLSWSWKVPDIIATANNSLAQVEDSPARVIVAFEGGRDKLPDDEKINYDLAKAIGGNELPYATIMYIWENHLPQGAVIPHHFSTRVQMVVAGSGRERLGVWNREVVNLLEDYRRIFEEEPPRVKSVGIMSDSDNTGTHTTAYYGDIRFLKHPPADSSASR